MTPSLPGHTGASLRRSFTTTQFQHPLMAISILLVLVMVEPAMNSDLASELLNSTTQSALVADSTVTTIGTTGDDVDGLNEKETAFKRNYTDNKTITEEDREIIRSMLDKQMTSQEREAYIGSGEDADLMNNNDTVGFSYVNASVQYLNNSDSPGGRRYVEFKRKHKPLRYRPIGAISGGVHRSAHHMQEDEDSPRRTKKHSDGVAAKAPNSRFTNSNSPFKSVLAHYKHTHRTTEFYAWVFGATMLSLCSFISLVSCFVFCLCRERWNLWRPKKKMHNNSEYERVDSISSMVDQNAAIEGPIYDPMEDDMTII